MRVTTLPSNRTGSSEHRYRKHVPNICADDGAKLTHRVTRWILQRLAIDRMSVSATAKTLGVGWELVNQVAVDACRTRVFDNFQRRGGFNRLLQYFL